MLYDNQLKAQRRLMARTDTHPAVGSLGAITIRCRAHTVSYRASRSSVSVFDIVNTSERAMIGTVRYRVSVKIEEGDSLRRTLRGKKIHPNKIASRGGIRKDSCGI